MTNTTDDSTAGLTSTAPFKGAATPFSKTAMVVFDGLGLFAELLVADAFLQEDHADGVFLHGSLPIGLSHSTFSASSMLGTLF